MRLLYGLNVWWALIMDENDERNKQAESEGDGERRLESSVDETQTEPLGKSGTLFYVLGAIFHVLVVNWIMHSNVNYII